MAAVEELLDVRGTVCFRGIIGARASVDSSGLGGL